MDWSFCITSGEVISMAEFNEVSWSFKVSSSCATVFLPGLTPMSCGGCPLGKQLQKCAWVKRLASFSGKPGKSQLNWRKTPSTQRVYFESILDYLSRWKDPNTRYQWVDLSQSIWISPKSQWNWDWDSSSDVFSHLFFLHTFPPQRFERRRPRIGAWS